MVSIGKLESDLWEAADWLRAGSKLTSNQCCMPVLGLIFLCYAYSRFKLVEKEILKNRPVRGGRVLPVEANNAMELVEAQSEQLTGVLPKNPRHILGSIHPCHPVSLIPSFPTVFMLSCPFLYSPVSPHICAFVGRFVGNTLITAIISEPCALGAFFFLKVHFQNFDKLILPYFEFLKVNQSVS